MNLVQSGNVQKDKQALKPGDLVLVDEWVRSWFPPIAEITNEARVIEVVNRELIAVRSLNERHLKARRKLGRAEPRDQSGAHQEPSQARPPWHWWHRRSSV